MAGLTVKGQAITSSQSATARTLLRQGEITGAKRPAEIAVIYAAMGESDLDPNAAGGGVLQGTSFPNPADVAGEGLAFFDGGQGFQGGGANHLVETGETDPVVIANTVEANYAWITYHQDSYGHQWPGGVTEAIKEATAIVDANGGSSSSSSASSTSASSSSSGGFGSGALGFLLYIVFVCAGLWLIVQGTKRTVGAS
ncbi:MAG TPA: hypothetical protein VG348_15925 [Acidimicrobiia bacterium]|jgi:hypothetical protein|nr:hypothetical protein [Acidimicrobiia bacterium]